ncbi:MAG: peptidoglycan DD-metalloendopeptidase family protein [Firmicutes bacterium]|nr:peptidoglycan DD-metalloendopeptidase family protein [Bacillota bacterium]
MARSSTKRRGVRLSRPDAAQFFTIMIVWSHRTFRWSIAKKTLFRVAATVAGVWAFSVIGSAYGFWATKKIMDFSHLQRETAEQERQLRESLDQARNLEDEVTTLRKQVTDLLTLLNPRAPGPDLPPMPSRGGESGSNTSEQVEHLKSALERSAASAKLMRARMEPLIDRWNRTPSIPPTAGYLSSGFGLRVSPFSRGNEAGDGILGQHTGFDITNAEGTPIQATADGEVVAAGWMDRYGWGVLVRHSKDLETLYAHMAHIDVQVGQNVRRGDILGGMGRSGNATGVHLHYEVRRQGKPVNPQPYMRLQRQLLSAVR